ncbi:hypothetical protein [Paenibacillus sp. 1P07SE]|uniref:hypothetical protein n=1 Tax=Paenibacillus sp. 1P07SE TaxID=3132209 RepID=UPI0039A6B747
MAQSMKRTLTIMLALTIMVLGMAASAFANPYNDYNYTFHYDGTYHAHSSGYIAGDAVVSGSNVTIVLSGNYFPEIEVGGISYSGSYNPATDLTTFTFPGSSSSDIELSLHVVVAPWHDAWYDLTLVWG